MLAKPAGTVPVRKLYRMSKYWSLVKDGPISMGKLPVNLFVSKAQRAKYFISESAARPTGI